MNLATFALADAFLGSGLPTLGKRFFVDPYTGNDGGRDGLSPTKAFKTLSKALSKCTAGRNDVVFLISRSNTAGNTTDYQTATLAWDKDMTHLIGINSGSLWSQRSRVAFISTYATASNLITVSANGCLISGVEFYAGVNNANPTGCLKVTGQRNVFKNCHIAGMGHATMDIAGAYSLKIDAGQENLFEDCTIGQDTVTLGAAVNAVMYFATGATRNYFRKCRFLLYTNHATNCNFLRAAAGSMDRYQWFEDCDFVNAIDSGSTGLTQAFVVAAGGSPAGGVLLKRCSLQGGTDWNSTDAGNVTALGGTVTAGTEGLGVDITR